MLSPAYVPAIHVLESSNGVKTWMPGIKSGMTPGGLYQRRFYFFMCFVRNSCVRFHARSPASLR
jgi:hypothetical protein